MSVDLFPVAGAHIDIGGVLATKLADFAATDFASQTWTEIDGWETMGASGDTAAQIKTSLINRKRDIKQKGTKDSGSMQNNFAIIPTDPGQIALIAAEKTSYNYAFRVRFDDAPAVVSSPVTMTIATPGVISWASHPFSNGDAVSFATTGALPTGLTPGTTYYVVGAASGTFSVAATAGGSAIATSGTQSGAHTGSSVTSGTVKYFIALVMTANEQGGSANTARMLQSSLDINSNIVTVAPAQ
jgi:archaellum component FlaG (FlaF/FlaG flagellin family)